MRQIATLNDVDLARRLADYLLTLDIETRLEHLPEGWAVWVCDEDRVARAREVLTEFLSNPSDPRYASASRGAAERRRLDDEAEESYRRRQVAVRDRWSEGAAPRVVTYTLVAISVAVGLATDLGNQIHRQDSPARGMLISAGKPSPATAGQGYLPEVVGRGQVWRLVTPIFLHFGLVHLLFNMIMLLDIGGRIESRIGTWRYLALVLVLAVASNLIQFYLGPFSLTALQDLFRPSPLFGGMSGVLYGLFGYLWMKSRYDTSSGLTITPGLVVILMAWLFVGLSGFLEQSGVRVANGAHVGGLLVGMLIGYVPHWWRQLNERE
jgi:GlpG protein